MNSLLPRWIVRRRWSCDPLLRGSNMCCAEGEQCGAGGRIEWAAASRSPKSVRDTKNQKVVGQ